MGLKKRRTFYLYEIGYSLKELCIGNLILKDYKEPTKSRHYTHPPLSDEKLNAHVSTLNLKDCMLVSKQESSFGVSLDLAELANLGFQWGSNEETVVAAKSGKRLELMNPQAFFDEEVFPQEAAQKQLRLWLSAAATNKRSAASKILQKPHVWPLTGVYILEDARTFSVLSRTPSVSAGISSPTIAALTTVPVGGTFDIGTSLSLKSNMVVDGLCVWAGQYRRLDVKYFWPGEKTILPLSIPLRNTFGYTSHGMAFSDNDPRTYVPPDRITVSVERGSQPAFPSSGINLNVQKYWVESELEEEDVLDIN